MNDSAMSAWSQLRTVLTQAFPQLYELEPGGALAMDLGFSSHSHFTLAFHRSFGLPPSACRSALAPARF